MAYTFYLGGMLLPVPPPSMTVQVKGANKTITLINEGEVNLLKTPGLTEISFDALLPGMPYPFAVYASGFVAPATYLAAFERMMSTKSASRLIVSRVAGGRLLHDTNMLVTLESYAMEESAKEGFDTIAKLKLKQWRPYGVKVIQAAASSAPVQQQAAEAPATPSTYTVKKGDCLWNIAKQFLGDGSRYKEIWNLNRDLISNPNLIFPGQVITMP